MTGRQSRPERKARPCGRGVCNAEDNHQGEQGRQDMKGNQLTDVNGDSSDANQKYFKSDAGGEGRKEQLITT